MNFDDIINTDIQFDQRVIVDPIMTEMMYEKSLSLSDLVASYNDGREWKIIPIRILDSYPVVFDKYYNKKKKSGEYTVSDISIVYCPYSSSVAVYFGKFVPTGEVYNNNIIIAKQNDKDNIIVQLLGEEYNRLTKKRTNDFVRREEVKIMTLRNALGNYPDCLILEKTIKLEPIIKKNYRRNTKVIFPFEKRPKDYHLKTLVYGIEYESKRGDFGKKYTAIVPKDASEFEVNSYNIKENGSEEYFNPVMIEKLRDKGGIITPCYYFAWLNMFPETKIVKL